MKSLILTLLSLVLLSGSFADDIIRVSNPIMVLKSHSSLVTSTDISSDGTFAVAGSDRTLILWDLSSGERIRTLTGHSFDVLSVAFSPDDKTVLSGSADGTVRLWHTLTGFEIRRFGELSNTIVTSVAFSPDGQYILAASTILGGQPGSNRIDLWEAKTAKKMASFQGGGPVAFTSSGKFALSTNQNHDAILMRSLPTGEILRTFRGHAGQVTSISVSTDGKLALSGSTDRSAILWDMSSGAAIRTLRGHTDMVSAVALSPDCRYALTGGHDGIAMLWSLATGQAVCIYQGPAVEVSSVAFTPDGKYMLSGSFDGSLRLWQVPNP